jgi:hypothetical protein
LGIMPGWINALWAVYPPEMRNGSGHMAGTLCGAVKQPNWIPGLNIVPSTNCRCFLRLGIMPRWITALWAGYPPEMRNGSGHMAGTLCGAVEQANWIPGLNIVLSMNCRCFLRLGIMPRWINAQWAVYPPEMRYGSGHMAGTLCGTVKQANWNPGLDIVLTMNCRCFLRMGIMPRWISALWAGYPPE